MHTVALEAAAPIFGPIRKHPLSQKHCRNKLLFIAIAIFCVRPGADKLMQHIGMSAYFKSVDRRITSAIALEPVLDDNHLAFAMEKFVDIGADQYIEIEKQAQALQIVKLLAESENFLPSSLGAGDVNWHVWNGKCLNSRVEARAVVGETDKTMRQGEMTRHRSVKLVYIIGVEFHAPFHAKNIDRIQDCLGNRLKVVGIITENEHKACECH